MSTPHRPVRRAATALAVTVASAASTAVAAPIVQAAPTAAFPQAVAAPGAAGLTPQLATAYTLAHRQARAEGVPLSITSGKRSRAEQARLWRDGVHTYGSAAQARRWVLPPGESPHVTGEAIDVGPRSGAAWLERTGHRWGLCRAFDNEWWHFELLTVPGLPCPARLPDASHR